jgi:hypothetical protein
VDERSDDIHHASGTSGDTDKKLGRAFGGAIGLQAALAVVEDFPKTRSACLRRAFWSLGTTADRESYRKYLLDEFGRSSERVGQAALKMAVRDDTRR